MTADHEVVFELGLEGWAQVEMEGEKFTERGGSINSFIKSLLSTYYGPDINIVMIKSMGSKADIPVLKSHILHMTALPIGSLPSGINVSSPLSALLRPPLLSLIISHTLHMTLKL